MGFRYVIIAFFSYDEFEIADFFKSQIYSFIPKKDFYNYEFVFIDIVVRAILIKPPLSNMWTSGGTNKLLNNYADAIGSELPDGDEIAALELREEIISHLRYLDMSVYNNVFNPIGSEGTSGATKELIRSYYEDPINEWTASKKAIDELIGLASQKCNQ